MALSLETLQVAATAVQHKRNVNRDMLQCLQQRDPSGFRDLRGSVETYDRALAELDAAISGAQGAEVGVSPPPATNARPGPSTRA